MLYGSSFGQYRPNHRRQRTPRFRPVRTLRQWRGAAAAERSVKTTRLTSILTAGLLLAGCARSQRTYFQVVDSVSKEPLSSAKVTAGLYDPLNADSRRTHTRAVFTGTNGLAVVKVPLCSTNGIHIRSTTGILADPDDCVGPEVLVEREGYDTQVMYDNNSTWRIDGEDTSSEAPLVIYLIRTRTELDGAANGSQPVRSQTNSTPEPAGSRR
jgi:hypothetical protein